MVDGAPARSGGQKPAAIYEMASIPPAALLDVLALLGRGKLASFTSVWHVTARRANVRMAWQTRCRPETEH